MARRLPPYQMNIPSIQRLFIVATLNRATLASFASSETLCRRLIYTEPSEFIDSDSTTVCWPLIKDTSWLYLGSKDVRTWSFNLQRPEKKITRLTIVTVSEIATTRVQHSTVKIFSFSTSLGNLPRSISNFVHRYTKNATIVGSRLNSILSRVVRERIERKQTSKRLT